MNDPATPGHSSGTPAFRPGVHSNGAQARALRQRGLFGRVLEIFRPRSSEGHLQHMLEELIGESDTASDGGGGGTVQHERTLIANILKLRTLSAYDIMVPRADIKAVDERISQQELIDTILREAHSRLPVYRGTLDHVIGMVHIKDVLASVSRPGFSLSQILRKVLFVAPSMRVMDLLLQMRLARVHLALVVDEYGGIDGLITIEDLVETIVGEIEDEHDEEEHAKLVAAADGTITLPARTALEDFEAVIGPFLSAEEREEDIDTVGGLVFSLAGRVPGRGELISHSSGIVFEILDADPRRVKRLRARNLPQPAAEPGPSRALDAVEGVAVLDPRPLPDAVVSVDVRALEADAAPPQTQSPTPPSDGESAATPSRRREAAAKPTRRTTPRKRASRSAEPAGPTAPTDSQDDPAPAEDEPAVTRKAS